MNTSQTEAGAPPALDEIRNRLCSCAARLDETNKTLQVLHERLFGPRPTAPSEEASMKVNGPPCGSIRDTIAYIENLSSSIEEVSALAVSLASGL